VLATLAQLHAGAAGTVPWEAIVVDNASADGTAAAIAAQFPGVRLFAQSVNHGACAKNVGISAARGESLVFLDDDSCPQSGCIDRMVSHFLADGTLGTAIFAVDLAGGGQECSAYPDVFAGCGVALRTSAVREVGGLPDDFFMQAEEYDLSLRLLDGGWGVRRFEDLRVTHLKTPQARFPARVMRLDVRNNLTLIARRFPNEWIIPFAADWARRYYLIAKANGCCGAYFAGLAAGLARLVLRRGREPVSANTFETFTKLELIRRRMGERVRPLGIRRVLMIDLGKNMLPYWLAARRCGLEVVAIADERLGGRGFAYHGCAIVKDAEAAKLAFDAAIVSNMSPVHAVIRGRVWAGRTAQPVIDLVGGDAMFASSLAA